MDKKGDFLAWDWRGDFLNCGGDFLECGLKRGLFCMGIEEGNFLHGDCWVGFLTCGLKRGLS